MSYWRKMAGFTRSPPRASGRDIAWSWLGAFLGIGAVGYLDHRLFEGTEFLLILGSFGASAVLVYGAVRSPLAQPRNLLGGHVVSAAIGVACQQALGSQPWLAGALAVATAIAAMHATKTLHPPGGATALIAVIGGPKVHSLGYVYVALPVGAGAAILLSVALLVNNLARERRYPEFWL